MGTADDEKDMRIGEIIRRAKKLAFQYRLTREDSGDWLRDGGYRDRIYRVLSRLKLPELEETEWPDEEIQDIIELATWESSEPPPVVMDLGTDLGIDLETLRLKGIDRMLDREVDRDLKKARETRDIAEAHLAEERAKNLRQKRDKPPSRPKRRPFGI